MAGIAPLRVDSHAHVFVQGLTLAEGRRYAPAYDAPVAEYLSMLDANGLTHGVLVQPSFLGTDNSYLVSALRVAPWRLRGIAMLPADVPGEEVARLAAEGVVGERLNLIGKEDPDLGADVWRRHLRLLADAGWQVEVQCEARRLPALLPPLLASGVTVVVDHFSRPDPALGPADPGFRALLEGAASGQVWVKLSGAYRLGPDGDLLARALARELGSAFGPDRLVWGSDWPHTQFERVASPAAALDALAHWVPQDAVREQVLGASAARLFGFSCQPAMAECHAGHAQTRSARAS